MMNYLELINKILSSNNVIAKELKIFDTHCHLSDLSYNEEEFLSIMNSISESGIHLRILNLGYDLESSIRTLKQSEVFPSLLYSAVGIHPENFNNLNDESIAYLEEMIKYNLDKIVAIGEIGLDYYRNPSQVFIYRQRKYFEKQVLLAKKYNLPISMHLRDCGNNSAFIDAIHILRKNHWYKGVVHCFSSNDYNIADQFIKLGFHISFSGTITFKNSKKTFNDLIYKIQLEKIVVETDSPYLSPEPFRGRKNFPWNIIFNLKTISDIKDISFFEVSDKVFSNSSSIFNIQ